MFKIHGRSQKTLSQNFLHNQQLVKKLVGKSSIGKNDTVLEIGSGNGIITRELLILARQVVAVEIDPELTSRLSTEINHPGLSLFEGDFLEFPSIVSKHKVFANIPFAIEGKIIRKLLDDKNSPDEIHLVVMADVGKRWVGSGKPSQFSMMYKPWFDMKISYSFKRSDFIPTPKVDSVMISIYKKENFQVPLNIKSEYQKFIVTGFGGGRRINTNLKRLISTKYLKKLAKINGFRFNAKPSDLDFDDWLKIWTYYSQSQKQREV